MSLSVLCFGEIVTDLIYKGNNSLVCKVGGAPLNVAVGLKRLGEKSTFVSSIGDDWFGEKAISYLKLNRVNHFVEFTHDVPTRTAIIFHGRGNERTFQFSPGIASENLISSKQLESAKRLHFDVLYFGSFPFAKGELLPIFEQFVDRIHDTGISTIFDPNLRLSVFANAENAKKICRKLVGLSDVVRLNVDELAFITGVTNLSNRRQTIERSARALVKMGPKTIFITDGKNGSYAYTSGKFEYEEAPKVRAIDTTGCGDAFTAALIVKYFRKNNDSGISLLEVLRWANAAGALASTRLGGADSMPSKVQIQKFLKSILRGGDRGKRKILSTRMSNRIKSKGRMT